MKCNTKDSLMIKAHDNNLKLAAGVSIDTN